ncbi:alpha-ketoglutarate-dependent 2,4-dichlorophenoxyacetate dioxygenase [Nemania sp. NC0429]|nr:alpha-ketoglutarate-dependent 2,4-dichlorophenoxyacetate dioxygenase [Nemania sp. NC0429]
MPGLLKDEEEQPFETIKVKQLHPTFAAEISGVDFENLSDEQFSEILAAMAKYGVCVFRNTGLSDDAHVSFSRRFGELDSAKRYFANGRKQRYEHYELFDAGNVTAEPLPPSSSESPNNNSEQSPELKLRLLDPTSPRAHANRGNGLFHSDSSFNPRRASFSLLRAAQLPPPDAVGGDTLFADSRTAAEELPDELLALLEGDEGAGSVGGGSGGLVGAFSMVHSRKLGSPEFFADLDPTRWPMVRHQLLQRHTPSGRKNLYVGAHLHHIEEATGADKSEVADSWALVQRLNAHATQDKYVVSVPWRDIGDLVIWDNRAVLHRAGPGAFDAKHVRDLRRTTVHDDSPTAWGLNEVGSAFGAFFTPPTVTPGAADAAVAR